MSKFTQKQTAAITTTKPEGDPEATKPTTDDVAAAAVPAAEPPKPAIAGFTALSDADLNAALKQLRSEIRRRDTAKESLRPKVGSTVRILRGRPKFVGQLGTAIVVRKSRCFVAVPGVDAAAYVLISDIEVVER